MSLLSLYRKAVGKDNVDKLRRLEKFLLCLSKIPRLGSKLEVLTARANASGILTGAREEIECLKKAVLEIKASVALTELLKLALHVSNFMNSGKTYVYRLVKYEVLYSRYLSHSFMCLREWSRVSCDETVEFAEVRTDQRRSLFSRHLT